MDTHTTYVSITHDLEHDTKKSWVSILKTLALPLALVVIVIETAVLLRTQAQVVPPQAMSTPAITLSAISTPLSYATAPPVTRYAGLLREQAQATPPQAMSMIFNPTTLPAMSDPPSYPTAPPATPFMGLTERDSTGYKANQKPFSLDNVRDQSVRPAKFLVDGITPSADQMARGDCWLFAMTGIIEDSYRRYGVEKGWLKASEYLKFSRQAIGISVMNFCKENPSALCPADVGEDGEIFWGNTTEDADERMLFFFKALGKSVLPESVCPYSRVKAGESVCVGREAALTVNPLEFNVTHGHMAFDSHGTKQLLLQYRKPTTIGVSMGDNFLYLPCTEETKPFYRGCAAGDCLPCPPQREFGHTQCCTMEKRSMVSMKGEWFYFPHGKTSEMGGHAIDVVGYTDVYKDEHGNIGGFIVRNSWSDGLGLGHGSLGRGSHSYLYYMREISDWDEARVCPNPHSPRSWGKCDSLEKCNSPVLRMQNQAKLAPMRLVCIDNGGRIAPGLCEKKAVHFMKNLSEWDSGAERAGLFTACFLRADTGADFCAPPLLLDDLATIFTPEGTPEGGTENGALPLNQPDVCGFNFIPYTVVEFTANRFGFFATMAFDIEWTRSSYPSQASEFEGEHFDYSLVEASLKRMPVVEKRAGPMWA